MNAFPSSNLHDCALYCLMLNEPADKADCVRQLASLWRQQQLQAIDATAARPLPIPGRPQRPVMAPPSQLPKRGFHTAEGRVRLAHAIAHIEFNAINLALDAVYRFRGMPAQYYSDWLQVAEEEAKHFGLLSRYLQDHDASYGDFPAHNGLWEMALKTDHDVLVRMALVPRVLEARGLDVTPGMIRRLQSTGDAELIAILQVIFDEEIGHVKIGSHWFYHVCQQRGLNPADTFVTLLQQYMTQGIAGPFELDARRAAGFTEQEMQRLAQLATGIGA